MPKVIAGAIVPELSRYEIAPDRSSILGSGGMGVVLKAHDLLYDRDVAIKTINPTFVIPEARTLFFREAAAHARLSIKYEDKIVAVRNYGIEDTMPFMELELLHGGSLRQRIHSVTSASRSRGPVFDEVTVRTICVQVAECLRVLHDHKAYHRDLKPENILFSEASDWALKIADLGIAHIAESGLLTKAGVNTFAGGTKDYTPLDVHYGRAKADATTDIYSLGVILCELLTRKPLSWPEADKATVVARTDLSKPAKDVITRACKLLGSRNYGTVDQFIDGLNSAGPLL